ncbi:indole-3-glycerol-phosphate synthase, partial [Candidatus Aerophobetes bacterium]
MILDEIVDNKLKEIAQRKKEISLVALKSRIATLAPTRDFKKAISSSAKINIIAEIKKSSPSAGLIREDFDPAKLATTYENNGASAISVLMDKKFFSGDPKNLTKVRRVSSLPILAKEFILDEYQIYEARVLGADAILLIARILDRENLRKYLDLASRLDLACLVEIHEEEGWEKIKDLSIDIVGINNRNLANFKVNLKLS